MRNDNTEEQNKLETSNTEQNPGIQPRHQASMNIRCATLGMCQQSKLRRLQNKFKETSKQIKGYH